MRRVLAGPIAGTLLLTVACSTGSPTPAASTPSPSPSPAAQQPLQRAEPSLPAAVEESAAAAVDGKLYVMGGFNAAGTSLNTVYVFDGTRWSAGPRLAVGLDHPSAATLDGHVYIAGGHGSAGYSARLFRLDTDRWTELASMHFARSALALIAADGALYAIGGNSTRGDVPEVEAYDPGADKWTVLSSLPLPRNHVAGLVLGDSVCVAGGRSPNTTRVDCLDAPGLSWSRLPNLPRATSGAGAIGFADGAVVMGGEDGVESKIIDQLAIYSPNGGWSSREMLSPRHGIQLAMFDGRAWACGGGNLAGLHPVATCTSLGDPATSKG
jgi:hypothetical protein